MNEEIKETGSGGQEVRESGSSIALSVVGFVLGLIGLLGSFIPCLGGYAFFIGIPGAIVSSIALMIAHKKKVKKAFPIVALTISIIGVAFSGFQFFGIIYIGNKADELTEKIYEDIERQDERRRAYLFGSKKNTTDAEKRNEIRRPIKNKKNVEQTDSTAIKYLNKYCGIWEYEVSGGKLFFKISKMRDGRFKFNEGYKYEGELVWMDGGVKNADGIYLGYKNGKTQSEFVSFNFRPTHGQDTVYKITLELKSENRIRYSVNGEIIEATRIVKLDKKEKAIGQKSNDNTKTIFFIIDKSTAFCWEFKDISIIDGKPNYNNPNDRDNQYSWYDKKEFIKKLNQAKFGGISQWRIPTLNELQSLSKNLRQSLNLEDWDGSHIWSSDSDPNNNAKAFMYSFYKNQVYSVEKTNKYGHFVAVSDKQKKSGEIRYNEFKNSCKEMEQFAKEIDLALTKYYTVTRALRVPTFNEIVDAFLQPKYRASIRETNDGITIITVYDDKNECPAGSSFNYTGFETHPRFGWKNELNTGQKDGCAAIEQFAQEAGVAVRNYLSKTKVKWTPMFKEVVDDGFIRPKYRTDLFGDTPDGSIVVCVYDKKNECPAGWRFDYRINGKTRPQDGWQH